MFDLSKITESVVAMDIAKTEELTRAAIDANIPVDEILNKAKVIRVKQIESFKSIEYTKASHRPKVRTPKGYEFVWYHSEMNRKRYAYFVAFRRKGV